MRLTPRGSGVACQGKESGMDDKKPEWLQKQLETEEEAKTVARRLLRSIYESADDDDFAITVAAFFAKDALCNNRGKFLKKLLAVSVAISEAVEECKLNG